MQAGVHATCTQCEARSCQGCSLVPSRHPGTHTTTYNLPMLASPHLLLLKAGAAGSLHHSPAPEHLCCCCCCRGTSAGLALTPPCTFSSCFYTHPAAECCTLLPLLLQRCLLGATWCRMWCATALQAASAAALPTPQSLPRATASHVSARLLASLNCIFIMLPTKPQQHHYRLHNIGCMRCQCRLHSPPANMCVTSCAQVWHMHTSSPPSAQCIVQHP
jgi:hypothetical protein